MGGEDVDRAALPPARVDVLRGADEVEPFRAQDGSRGVPRVVGGSDLTHGGADGEQTASGVLAAQEEVDLDPASVTVFGQLPGLWLRASSFIAVPVLAWWHTPHPLAAEEAECEAVARLPLRALADPANRWMVRHESGYQGPAFDLADPLDPQRRWFVWGFTAGVITQLLAFGGWAQEWDQSRSRPLPS